MEGTADVPNAWARAVGRKKTGRPSTFNEEIAEDICEALASSSEGLQHICERIAHFPDVRTVYKWLERFPPFGQMYSRARERKADFVAAETILIADTDPDPQRARNRILARQWMAAKLNPRRYGDKLGVDVTVAGDLGDRLNAAFQAAAAPTMIESTAVDVTPGAGHGAE